MSRRKKRTRRGYIVVEDAVNVLCPHTFRPGMLPWDTGFISVLDVQSLPMWSVCVRDVDKRYFSSEADAEQFLECWRIVNGRDPMTGELK